MAKRGDQVRGGDVTFWGVFAIVAWAVAILGAGVSSFLPPGVLGGLHASFLEGGTLNQLRGDVAALQSEAAKLRRDNTELTQRFALTEQTSSSVTRRVGALELTLPRLLEASAASSVDRGAVTASTGSTTLNQDGTARYSTTPLASGTPAVPDPTAQPMPAALPPIAANSDAFGIAVGPPIESGDGTMAWDSINAKAGALLLGLGPLLGPVEGGPGKRLVIGPLTTEAEARQLCGRFAKIGIACASVPFVGDPVL